MEFASAMFVIQPCFDYDVDLSLEMMDTLQKLSSDADSAVVEAVEQTDFNLLQSRKQNKKEEEKRKEQEKLDF